MQSSGYSSFSVGNNNSNTTNSINNISNKNSNNSNIGLKLPIIQTNSSTSSLNGTNSKSSPIGYPKNSPSPMRLPSYTEVTNSPSIAAGIPVLELVRKLEEEKILVREDRIALNEALYNPNRREKVMLALRDVELGTNPRFAIRRLKVLIHQNNAGVPITSSDQKNGSISSSMESIHEDGSIPHAVPPDDISLMDPNINVSAPRPREQTYTNFRSKAYSNNDNDSVESSTVEVSTAITQVVGPEPLYSGPEYYNVCNKIGRRLKDFLKAYQPSKMGVRKLAILVGSGSCNPLTRMHMRTYFLAKQFLEQKAGFIVLGSLLSPAHSSTARERYRTNPSEIIPSPHRLAIAQLLVQDSKWFSIDPWEITRRRAMDYLSLLEHQTEVLKEFFPNFDIKILYLCKPSMVAKISPQSLRSQNYGCVCVCRAPESDQLRASLSAKWNGLIWVIEDAAILDASMDLVSSRNVREKIKSGDEIADMVGETIQTYVRSHKIGEKMRGEEKWTDEEKKLPKVSSRHVDPRSYLTSSYSMLYSGSTVTQSITTASMVPSLAMVPEGHESNNQNDSQNYENDDISISSSIESTSITL